MRSERRRTPRLDQLLGVEVKRDTWEQRIVDSVSRGGLYMRSFDALPLYQLLQIRFTVAGREPFLNLIAQVVRSEPPEEALAQQRLPGVGLEFFCLKGDAEKRWIAFVDAIRVRRGHRSGVMAGTSGRSAMVSGMNGDFTLLPAPAGAFAAGARR